jgi:hypothetical protein
MSVLAGTPGDVYDAPVWTGHEAHVDLIPSAEPLHLALASSFPQGVVTAHHVVSAKLNVLRRIQDGWLGPGSLAPTPQAFEHYWQFLVALGDTISLDAEAVASGEGTLQVEWERDGVTRLIEFTDRGAWLLESNDEGDTEYRIEPFDAQPALIFFHGEPT